MGKNPTYHNKNKYQNDRGSSASFNYNRYDRSEKRGTKSPHHKHPHKTSNEIPVEVPMYYTYDRSNCSRYSAKTPPCGETYDRKHKYTAFSSEPAEDSYLRSNYSNYITTDVESYTSGSTDTSYTSYPSTRYVKSRNDYFSDATLKNNSKPSKYNNNSVRSFEDEYGDSSPNKYQVYAYRELVGNTGFSGASKKPRHSKYIPESESSGIESDTLVDEDVNNRYQVYAYQEPEKHGIFENKENPDYQPSRERMVSVTNYDTPKADLPLLAFKNRDIGAVRVDKVKSGTVYFPVLVLENTAQLSQSRVLSPERLMHKLSQEAPAPGFEPGNFHVFAADVTGGGNIFQAANHGGDSVLNELTPFPFDEQSGTNSVAPSKSKSKMKKIKLNDDGNTPPSLSKSKRSFLPHIFSRSKQSSDYPVSKSYIKVGDDKRRQKQRSTASHISPTKSSTSVGQKSVGKKTSSKSLLGGSKSESLFYKGSKKKGSEKQINVINIPSKQTLKSTGSQAKQNVIKGPAESKSTDNKNNKPNSSYFSAHKTQSSTGTSIANLPKTATETKIRSKSSHHGALKKTPSQVTFQDQVSRDSNAEGKSKSFLQKLGLKGSSPIKLTDSKGDHKENVPKSQSLVKKESKGKVYTGMTEKPKDTPQKKGSFGIKTTPQEKYIKVKDKYNIQHTDNLAYKDDIIQKLDVILGKLDAPRGSPQTAKSASVAESSSKQTVTKTVSKTKMHKSVSYMESRFSQFMYLRDYVNVFLGCTMHYTLMQFLSSFKGL